MNLFQNKTVIASYLLILSFFFAATTFFIPNKSSAQQECLVNEAVFSTNGEQLEGWYDDNDSPQVTITVKTQGCAEKLVKVSLREGSISPFTNVDALNNKVFKIPQNETLSITLITGEDECNSTPGVNDCHYDIQVITDSSTFTSRGKTSGDLMYECHDMCFSSWYILDHTGLPNGCEIKNAYFTNVWGDQDSEANKAARQGEDFWGDTPPSITAEINTSGCYGKEIKVSIMERDRGELSLAGYFVGGVASIILDQDNPTQDIYRKSLIVNDSDKVTLQLVAGDEECDTSVVGVRGCRFYIEVDGPNNTYNSWYAHPKGRLEYDFDLLSNTNWRIITTTSINDTLQPIIPGGSSPTYQAGDPCVNEEGTGLKDRCYAVLAPLSPELTEVGDDFTLGKYINILVQIAIGIAGILAVIMIIVGGVQYMTTDALTGKSNARSTITSAILGLLIALGSFIILNTINPTLTKIEPDIRELEAVFKDDSALWKETESTDITGYTLKGTFENPQPSTGVANFVQNLEQSNASLEEITVITPGPGPGNQGSAKFKGSNGSEVVIPVALGKNGVSTTANQEPGDGKTPLGSYELNSDIRPETGVTKNLAAATKAENTPINLGAYYGMIDITYKGALRGIGFHGHKNNTLGPTNGCVRMYNDDLVVLSPFMKAGTKVTIVSQ